MLLVGLASIQCASDSLYADASVAGAFPSRIPERFGVSIYRLLDRFAPAPYVESTLARQALSRGDTDAAEHYAVRLPPDAVRNGILANIARARGQDMLAFEYAFAAPDISGVQAVISNLRVKHPDDAYRLEERFRDRLIALQTHPDAVAHAWWMLADIAASMPGPWQSRAYDDYVIAAGLAPLDLQNLLGVADQAVTLGRWNEAARWYRRVLDVDPASADAVAGLGIVALVGHHDAATARRRLARARALDPSSRVAGALERKLRARP